MTSDTTLLMMTSFVQSALRARTQPSSTPASGDRLAEILTELTLLARQSPTSPDATAKLVAWISAISQSVAHISRADGKLVDTLLGVPWLVAKSDQLAETFLHLIENLVSAQPMFVMAVVKSLVGSLHLRRSTTEFISPDVYYNRLHAAMRAVLTINRTGPTVVVPLLANEFPHHSRPLIDQQAYVQNLLRMLSYAPVLREQVLGLIVDRIVQLDVELQVDVEDLDANPSDAQFLFEMDGVSPDGIPDGPVSTTAPSSPTVTTANIVALNGAGASAPVEGGLLYDSDDDLLDNDDDGGDGTSGGATMGPSAEALMAKLDHLLYIVLSYLSSGAATQHCSLADVYTTLLSIFDRLILPTYKSRHTQFLLFYLASRDPAFTDVFLGMLAHKIMSTAEPTIVRMSAALYMASFVARANYLPPHHVAGCFRLLVQWCGAFVVANEQYVTYPDVNKFGVFYAVTQAVLYMFCFRWRELMGELGEKGGLEGFELVVLSKFNPLKVLSPPVVNEFARITHEQNVLYCYAIIQRNKRLYLPTQRSAISSTGASNDSGSLSTPSSYTLDTFFPFDPFKLPLSSAFIDPLYTAWQGQDDATATAVNSPDSSAHSSPFVTPATREGTPVPFTHQGPEGESRNPSFAGATAARAGGAQSAPGMPRAMSSAGSVRRRGSGGTASTSATHTPARPTSSGAASFHHVGGHYQNDPALPAGHASGSSPFHGNGPGTAPHQHSTGFFSQPPSPSSTIVSLSGYGSERRGPSMSPTAQPSQPMRVPSGRSPLRRNGAAGDAGFDMEGGDGAEEDGLVLSEGMQAMSISPDRQGSSVLMSQLGMGRQ